MQIQNSMVNHPLSWRNAPTSRQPSSKINAIPPRPASSTTGTAQFNKTLEAEKIDPVFSKNNITVKSSAFNPPLISSKGLNPLARAIKIFFKSFTGMFKVNNPETDRSELVDKIQQRSFAGLWLVSMVVSTLALLAADAFFILLMTNISAGHLGLILLTVQFVIMTNCVLLFIINVAFVTPITQILSSFVAAIVDTHEKLAAEKMTDTERFIKKYRRMEKLFELRLEQERNFKGCGGHLNFIKNELKFWADLHKVRIANEPDHSEKQIRESTNEIFDWLQKAEKQMKTLCNTENSQNWIKV